MQSTAALLLVIVYPIAIIVAAAALITWPPILPPIRRQRHRAVLLSIALLTLGSAIPNALFAPIPSDERLLMALTFLMDGAVVAAAYLFIRNIIVKRARRTRERREGASLVRRAQSALAEMQAELTAAYPYLLQSPSGGETSFLCMPKDGSSLRFLKVATADGVVKREADVCVPLAGVISVDLVTHEDVVTQSTTQTRKKGTVARAVVGEALFGPTGALIGAVSAGSTSTTTGVQHRLYQHSELVFGLRDLQNPVVRFFVTDRIEADRWLHRIRSAMHQRLSEAAPADLTTSS